MKKILLSFLAIISLAIQVNANEIQKYIKQSDFELKSVVSIYMLDQKTGNVIFKNNEDKLLNPASTLKTLTFGASYLELGKNYKFETALYCDKNNNLYLKLGADPLLTHHDLDKLFIDLKKEYNVGKIKNIYIDDTIIDKTPYIDGWTAGDIWPKSRPLTPYIVDGNRMEIGIQRSSLSKKVDVVQNGDYKLPIINELEIGEKDKDKHQIKIARLYGDNSPIVNLQGTVTKDDKMIIPVLNPELNFNIKLVKAIDDSGIIFNKKITTKKMPSNTKKIVSVSHNIKEVSRGILLNSDNFASEIVFKVAGAKYINYSHPAKLEDAIKMFKARFKPYMTEGIKISDGSGVSRYNLVNTKFIATVLRELFKDAEFKKLLATANRGTLANRLPFLENNLRAKTGTLSRMSSIVGTLKTRKNRDVVFAIIVQNSPKRSALLKNFENTLIGIIYKKY